MSDERKKTKLNQEKWRATWSRSFDREKALACAPVLIQLLGTLAYGVDPLCVISRQCIPEAFRPHLPEGSWKFQEGDREMARERLSELQAANRAHLLLQLTRPEIKELAKDEIKELAWKIGESPTDLEDYISERGGWDETILKMSVRAFTPSWLMSQVKFFQERVPDDASGIIASAWRAQDFLFKYVVMAFAFENLEDPRSAALTMSGLLSKATKYGLVDKAGDPVYWRKEDA